jgi:hypothetical protein
MEACWEVTEACLAKMGASQGKLEAKMEASQEKTEAIAEHYKWEPCVKATHLLTTLQGWASDVLHGDPSGATYKETIWSLEDRFGNQHLVTLYRTQMKTRTQIITDPLPEFATVIKQLTCRAFPALHWTTFLGEHAGHS